MLTSIRIQNFRSIRDASVKLGQVNLFIGPNNSGKSNFLKGIELLARRVVGYNEKSYPRSKSKEEQETLLFFKENILRNLLNRPINEQYISLNAMSIGEQKQKLDITILIKENQNINSRLLFGDKTETEAELEGTITDGQVNDFTSFQNQLSHVIIYRINSDSFQLGLPSSTETYLSNNASNIVSYLFYLSQNYKPSFRRLEADLAQCVGNLVSVSTPADPEEQGKLKLKFFDQNDVGYWAEEVSEGVLYFLALLCIVHQPDPPKLLLLEEPEKGIHPRRIREVMNFIFELARQRNIQIILTSHSPYVVDHFADIPECISVFDRKDGETVIHNAADIISETNTKLEAAGEEPIHYTDALGEYWVSGFLGGVPETIIGM